MFLWITLLIIGCALGVALLSRSRPSRRGFVSADGYMQQRRRSALAATEARPAVARRDYRAVSIRCGEGACYAARVLQGKRGLPQQLPRLPLSSCNAEACRCTLKRHADRRDADDRRALYAGMHGIQLPDREERRDKPDRRSASAKDLAAFRITYS